MKIFLTPLPLTRSQTRLSSTIVPLLTVHVLYLYIPQGKMTLKIGTSGENSAVFKPYFPLQKDSETLSDLTPTMANI